MRRWRAAAALAAGLAALPIASEMRVMRPVQPLTTRWQDEPVEPHGATLLGINLRSPQVDALRLDPRATLDTLLAYPFELIRLGAYWSRIESAPGRFEPNELDRQIEAAERAGKRIVLCVGALKTFGYPEFFVPPHRLQRPIREGSLVRSADARSLLEAAIEFATRVVERYRDRQQIVAWQVEHEAVDPLGMEHSWRLAADFVEAEVAAVRRADPSRPVLLNGYLPMSLPVSLQQWWRTRDQGDSLAVATRLADIVGLDVYPRHALVSLGPWTVYLDGSRSPWQQRAHARLIGRAIGAGRRVMVSEGQAEPWEAVTTPPDPPDGVMVSCPPGRLIENYNACLRWQGADLSAYLFWGAEYWVLRDQRGDPSYLRAFVRILEQS